MALPQPVPPFSANDYLRWEAEQPEKHEYVRGETFAMGGASRRHVTISGNVFNALDGALDGTPCRAYMADMKVQAAVSLAATIEPPMIGQAPARLPGHGVSDRG